MLYKTEKAAPVGAAYIIMRDFNLNQTAKAHKSHS